jgi:formamidopyrimidine-DNA glycosylase
LFLNQKVVVGLGNIYCDEVCFEAGVRPDRKVESLEDQELELLYEAIVRIIPAAIKAGGSSVANYVLGDGSRGTFVEEHKVYNRGGMECMVCGEELAKEKLAGRTTVFCENCQK